MSNRVFIPSETPKLVNISICETPLAALISTGHKAPKISLGSRENKLLLPISVAARNDKHFDPQ